MKLLALAAIACAVAVYAWLRVASDREGMLANVEPADDEAVAA